MILLLLFVVMGRIGDIRTRWCLMPGNYLSIHIDILRLLTDWIFYLIFVLWAFIHSFTCSYFWKEKVKVFRHLIDARTYLLMDGMNIPIIYHVIIFLLFPFMYKREREGEQFCVFISCEKAQKKKKKKKREASRNSRYVLVQYQHGDKSRITRHVAGRWCGLCVCDVVCGGVALSFWPFFLALFVFWF